MPTFLASGKLGSGHHFVVLDVDGHRARTLRDLAGGEDGIQLARRIAQNLAELHENGVALGRITAAGLLFVAEPKGGHRPVFVDFEKARPGPSSATSPTGGKKHAPVQDAEIPGPGSGGYASDVIQLAAVLVGLIGDRSLLDLPTDSDVSAAIIAYRERMGARQGREQVFSSRAASEALVAISAILEVASAPCPTALAIAEALGRTTSETPTQVHPVKPPVRIDAVGSGKSTPRQNPSRRGFVVAAAAATFAALVLGFLLWPDRNGEQADTKAPELTLAREGKDFGHWPTGEPPRQDASATDDRDGSVRVAVESETEIDGNRRRRTTSFSARDRAGNTAMKKSIDIWHDHSKPPQIRFDNPTLIDLSDNPTADNVLSDHDVLAQNDSSPVLKLTEIWEEIQQQGCQRVLIVNYSVTDCCGNADRFEVTYRWREHMRKRTIHAEYPIVIQVDDPVMAILPDLTERVSWSQCGIECLNPTSISQSPPAGCLIPIDNIPEYVTLTAKFECQAEVSIMHPVEVLRVDRTAAKPDQTAPRINPSRAGRNFGHCTPDEIPEATALDDRDGAVNVTNRSKIEIQGYRRLRTTTYTARDLAGNAATLISTDEWHETSYPPVIHIVGESERNLGDNPDVYKELSGHWHEVFVEDDHTSELEHTCTVSNIERDGCGRTQAVTYSATDCCGNTATAKVTYHWREHLNTSQKQAKETVVITADAHRVPTLPDLTKETFWSRYGINCKNPTSVIQEPVAGTGIPINGDPREVKLTVNFACGFKFVEKRNVIVNKARADRVMDANMIANELRVNFGIIIEEVNIEEVGNASNRVHFLIMRGELTCLQFKNISDCLTNNSNEQSPEVVEHMNKIKHYISSKKLSDNSPAPILWGDNMGTRRSCQAFVECLPNKLYGADIPTIEEWCGAMRIGYDAKTTKNTDMVIEVVDPIDGKVNTLTVNDLLFRTSPNVLRSRGIIVNCDTIPDWNYEAVGVARVKGSGGIVGMIGGLSEVVKTNKKGTGYRFAGGNYGSRSTIVTSLIETDCPPERTGLRLVWRLTP